MAVRQFCDSRLECRLEDYFESLDDFKILEGSNYILVERISDTEFYEGTDLKVVKAWNHSVHSERIFRVAKTPQKLVFDPESSSSLLFDTDMEIEVGDIVMSNSIESLNSYIYTFEGKTYHTIKYDKFICKVVDNKPIPLNGYVLVSPVEKTRKLGFYENKFYAENEGIIEAFGTPNRDYKRNYIPESREKNHGRQWSDEGYSCLNIGDRVIFDSTMSGKIAFWGYEKGASIYPLERMEHRTLDKMYYVLQRPKIAGVLGEGVN